MTLSELTPPRPRLGLACVALLGTTLLLMLARVVRLAALPEAIFGLPGPLVGRVTIYSLALLSLFGAYVYAIYCVRVSSNPRLGRIVIGLTALFTLPALISRDLFSPDMYSYIIYGRMAGVHGLNPYVHMPVEVRSDPYLSYVYWRSLLTPYGPLWTSWSAFLDLAVPGGVRLQVFTYKLLGALVHMGNTLLIGVMVRRVSPRNVALAMAVYGWNPLPLWEFAGNAHNDAFMLFFILAALLALHSRRVLLGAGLLGVAIATKFTAALFLPFYLLALYRSGEGIPDRLRKTAIAAAVTGGVWLISWVPYWGDGGWRRMISLPEQSEWYLNSLPSALFALVRYVLALLFGLAPSTAGYAADKVVTLATVTIILLVGLRLAARLHDTEDLAEVWFWFFFAYLAFVGPYFWPWYATTLIPLAAMTRQTFAWILSTILSVTVMLVYSCGGCRTYFNASDSPLTGLGLFLPVLLFTAFTLRRNRGSRSLEGITPQYG